ncbi:Inositol-1-monophosphatase [uncultured Clostridium sp.]|nr:Inositol-1-monophosphatase [uncultured Clostridium sp.]
MDKEARIIALLARAGRAMVEFEKDFDVIEKGGSQNYVTTVDLRVQRMIAQALEEICPEGILIAEEDGLGKARTAPCFFVLDPIDGTSNLMHGMKHSAISLSMHEAGRYTLAIVYDPYLEEMFVANRKGAFLNGAPIHVSSRPLADALIGFGTNPYDRTRSHENFAALEALFYHCHEIRRSGSAALDLAYVACGRLDGMFEQNLQAWDFSAGRFLVEQAGGRVTDYALNSPDPTCETSLIASNGLIHEQMHGLITGGRNGN